MTFRNSKGEWRVVFHHDRPAGHRGTTIAQLDRKAPRVSVLFAAASVAKGDTFCKETGRKVALTKLMHRAGLFCGWSKEDRRAAWQAYFGRIPAVQEVVVTMSEPAYRKYCRLVAS